MGFLENRTFNTWTEHTEESLETAKKMILAERLFIFVHIISCKWVDGKILKNAKNNSQIHFVQQILGRLIYCIDVEEGRRFMKDIYIILTTKRSSDLAEYHLPCTDN